ncbi:enoyl-CoA hydratase/isomerase [Syncephalis pseudoplumigaleata]|uniref:Enoyl-CoA hydratase/isomerase n=1 Tax=Syncephalis pseudoplumigaleata TaxID=1712513 RepID=A0A4P9YRR1_9FUNG|nr:enoyl-CoA hydratase/isomerase [Syncephalis pseudoplumigaleata]|eukprot:RKP22527.1 enoyl-CoA hydratase/isomerase [Syncephalis pseudoplumigaleata]
MSSYASLKHIKASRIGSHVLHVQLNRPERLNAFNSQLWQDLHDCFATVAHDTETRVVVLSALGKTFTAGLDCECAAVQEAVSVVSEREDPARTAYHLRKKIADWQNAISAVEKCDRPVIAAIHGACIGAGVDLSTACDVRYCSKDAFFSVKEVDIGMAADVGTLQRLPKVVGNNSWVREICFTARNVPAEEAHHYGLVGRVFGTREELLENAIALANEIAGKSPIATLGTKHLLNYSRDHTVDEGLAYTVAWNAAMLQSTDLKEGVMAGLQKRKPLFANL